jgi:hypothetical protein
MSAGEGAAMSEHHEVECDECGKRAPLEQVQLANGVTLHAWARPNGWHRVDRRDLCSWNCRLAHDSNVQVNR